MPYKIEQRDNQYCVMKASGETLKCYDAKADAEAYLTALNLNVDKAVKELRAVRLKGSPNDGVMVALRPSPEAALAVNEYATSAFGDADVNEATPTAPDLAHAADLHVTVCYLGDTDVLGAQGGPTEQALIEALTPLAAAQTPFGASINGLGRFYDNPDQHCIYLNVDAPALSSLRYQVEQACRSAGVPPEGTHGYTPHMTLAYVHPNNTTPSTLPPPLKLAFDKMYLYLGDQRIELPFASEQTAPQPADEDLTEEAGKENGLPVGTEVLVRWPGGQSATGKITDSQYDHNGDRELWYFIDFDPDQKLPFNTRGGTRKNDWADAKYVTRKDIHVLRAASLPVTWEYDHQQLKQGATVFRGSDGLRYMFIVTSNGYKDREDEFVRTQALKSYVDSRWVANKRFIGDNELLFWHEGDNVGSIVWADMEGPFLLEVAKEAPNRVIKLDARGRVRSTVKQVWDYIEAHPEVGWGASHGFGYPAKERGDYQHIQKFETSVLPLAYAANPYTYAGVLTQ